VLPGKTFSCKPERRQRPGRASLFCLCRRGRAVFWIPRQVIFNLEPGDAVFGPDVVVDLGPVRLIETAERHLYTVSKHLFVHGKGAPASSTEPAFGVLRRTVACRFAFDPGEGLDRKVHECQYRRPRMLAAHRTVADDAAHRHCSRAITNRAAQAPAFKNLFFTHCALPIDITRSVERDVHCRRDKDIPCARLWPVRPVHRNNARLPSAPCRSPRRYPRR
jgi:hypothetical protein